MSTHNTSILLLLLIALTYQQSDYYNHYEISPTLPPTAFIGQYYTVNFRVSGLSNPHFTFDNLPSCFTSSSSGTIQGTPDAVGSYNIKVTYRNELEYGEKSIVLRVSTSDYSSEVSKSDGFSNKNVNWIELDVPSLYQVGDRISINLNKYAQSNVYAWSYIQLPQMLEGDSSGKLIGSFYDEGYYSFGATCSNKQGISLDYFFTFNIQPIRYKGKNKVLSEIPNRNVFKYSFLQIQAMQNEARLNVQKAQKLVAVASKQLGIAQGRIAATQSNIKMANTQVAVVEKVVDLALKQKGKQFNKLTQLQAKRDKAQGAQAIKKTAYNQAVKNANSVQKILDLVSGLFDKLTQIFNSINQKFIDAQNQRSQAETDLSNANKNYVNANVDVKSSFQDVLNAKKLLQAAKNNKSLIDFNVSAAFDQRGIANFQNDAANSQYNVAEKIVTKALNDLKTANSTVLQLQQQLSYAKNSVGQAQFDLLQAMNRLFVAQAAKGQSDKAILIASAQSSQLPVGETTYIFSGCQIANYPIISGTACIQRSSAIGYELNSGYTLLFGDCTQKVNASEGDIVKFKGYLRDGFIHGVKIDKN